MVALLRLQERDPAASSVDEAMAAARRPYVGCETARCVKLVRAPSDDANDSSPLAADPAFEFTETPVVVIVAPQPRKATASSTTVPLVMSPSTSGHPLNTTTPQQPRMSMSAFEPLKLDGSDGFPTPPRSPMATTDVPMSPLFGRKVVIAATSTLGRLEPPPPLVLPPPPAFDRLRGPASPQVGPLSPQRLPLQQPQQPPQQQQQQPQQQQAQPQRVSLVTMLTEDVTLTFGSSGDVQVALEGHVQLGFVTASSAPVADAPPLEFDVALADRAGQVAAAKPNAAVLSVVVPTSSDKHEHEEDDRLFGHAVIPEANSTNITTTAPAPAATTTDPASPAYSYRCRISRDRLATPLVLLRYEAKPAVRPVPVRIQQCLVRVEAGVAHVVAQLAVNPNLFMPLAAASLAVQLLAPGLEFGQALLAASPPAGVSYAPPLLQWTLPEELKPGTTLLFKASVPLISNTNTEGANPSSSSWPLRALFKAQSARAGLTKVGVQYQQIQQLQQPQPAYELDVQAPKRRFRVTARFEP